MKQRVKDTQISLMLDHEGYIAEATGANIFFKNKNNELHTPIPDSFLTVLLDVKLLKLLKIKKN